MSTTSCRRPKVSMALLISSTVRKQSAGCPHEYEGEVALICRDVLEVLQWIFFLPHLLDERDGVLADFAGIGSLGELENKIVVQTAGFQSYTEVREVSMRELSNKRCLTGGWVDWKSRQ